MKTHLWPPISTRVTVLLSPGSNLTAVPAAIFCRKMMQCHTSCYTQSLAVLQNLNALLIAAVQFVDFMSELYTEGISSVAYQPHSIRELSVKGQILVGLHEVVVGTDLDGTITDASNIQGDCTASNIDLNGGSTLSRKQLSWHHIHDGIYGGILGLELSRRIHQAFPQDESGLKTYHSLLFVEDFQCRGRKEAAVEG